MDVAIVKYNAGNIYSVVNAMKRLGIEPVLTDDAEMLQKADRVLFPGQGQAREAMEYLKAHQLDQVIKNLKQPVLGICVGQQLLCRHSEEGDVDCIGIFDVDVKRFQPQKHEDKVPAMGWNEIYDLKTDLYKGFGNRMDSDSDKSTADALLHPYSYFDIVIMCHSARRPLPRQNTFFLIAHRSTKTISIPASSIRKRAEKWENRF